MNRRSAALVMAAVLTVGGTGLVGEQVYLKAKASVARGLISRAWARTLTENRSVRPWPWADLHPVAELEFGARGLRRVVLSGATGGTLAFGVGHVDGTAAPNRPGTCALAGHKDGAFAFLEDVRPGEQLQIRTPGSRSHYRVVTAQVIPASNTGLLAPTDTDRLILITCFPFGLRRSTDQRWVVICEPEIPCSVPGGRPGA